MANRSSTSPSRKPRRRRRALSSRGTVASAAGHMRAFSHSPPRVSEPVAVAARGLVARGEAVLETVVVLAVADLDAHAAVQADQFAGARVGHHRDLQAGS